MPDDATTKPSRRRTPPLRPVGADSTPRPSQRNTRACAHRKTNHEETSRTPRWQLAPRPPGGWADRTIEVPPRNLVLPSMFIDMPYRLLHDRTYTTLAHH